MNGLPYFIEKTFPAIILSQVGDFMKNVFIGEDLEELSHMSSKKMETTAGPEIA